MLSPPTGSMSSLAPSSDATRSRWEDLREDIHNWYLNEGCGLEEVRTRLNAKHQFIATKYQLENQLNKWGFRKNITKADWEVIKRRIEKRRREGEDSEVWRDGRQVDPKRVKRAISRYRLSLPIRCEGVWIGAPLLSIEMPREMSLPSSVLSQPNMNHMVYMLPIVEFALLPANLSVAVDGFNPGADMTLSVSGSNEILLNVAAYFQRDGDQCGRATSTLWALQNIIPTAVLPNLLSNTMRGSPKLDEVWRFLVYLISNKLIDLTSATLDATYHWIKQHLEFGWAHYLSRSRGPTIEAFLEQLFLLAIEKEDSQMVQDLLNFASGRFNPDQILCRASDFRPEHITPLQRSCELKNLELSKILLNAGADVNYAPKPDSPYSKAPLVLALSETYLRTREGPKKRCPSLDQVKLLINAGADADFSALDFAVRKGDMELIGVLITTGVCPNPPRDPFLREMHPPGDPLLHLSGEPGGVSLLMTALESNTATKDKIAIILNLIEAGADVKYSCHRSVWWSEHSVIHKHLSRPNREYYHFYDSNHTAAQDEISSNLVQRYGVEDHSLLTCAVQQSNDSLIDSLMKAGAPITACALDAAVAMDRLDLVKVFLESGVQPNGRAIEFAVRSERNDILQLLLESSDPATRESHTRRLFVEVLRYGHTKLANPLTFEDVCLFSADDYFNYCLGTAIESAARRADTQILRKIFAKNSSNQDTFLPFLDVALAESIVQQNTEVVSMLLSAWSDLDTDSGYGGESLEAAIAQRDLETSKQLLELGAEPTIASLRGAIEWGHLYLISDLLDVGTGYGHSHQYMWNRKIYLQGIFSTRKMYRVEFDARDIESHRDECREGLLTTSVKLGHHHVTQLLLAAGFGERPSSKALESAISTGDMGLVSLILDSGAEVSELSLIRAICWERDLVKTFLKRKSGGSGFGVVSLQIAICFGDYALIETLLSNGVSPNWFASIPSELYDFDIQCDILDDFLWSELNRYCNHPNPSRKGKKLLSKLRGGVIDKRSPFGTAIEIHEDDEIIQLLLRYGADPNQVTSSRLDIEYPEDRGDGVLRITETPLLQAISKEDPGLVRMLLDAGAELNPTRLRGCPRTPLQRAAEVGSIQLVRFLLDRGAHVNAPPWVQRGATALQFAAIKGHLDTVLLLVSNGADVNARSARVGGRTAIEGAAEHGRIDMIEMLVRAGARLVGDGSRQYDKALRLAAENSHMAVHRLLQKHHRFQLGHSLEESPIFDLGADQLIGFESTLNFEDSWLGPYIEF